MGPAGLKVRALILNWATAASQSSGSNLMQRRESLTTGILLRLIQRSMVRVLTL